MNKIAVMDLGTNTFHLLIATVFENKLNPVFREEVPVKLGDGGLTKGLILEPAFNRGLQTMDHFHQIIQKENIHVVRAVATSAMRNAKNGKEFIQEVKNQTGITIEIINGQQEAEFIYQGVRASQILTAQNSLIMDIGGGSVEFILCNQEQIYWKQSFEIGVVRLMEQFHQQDPIPETQISALNNHLKTTLKELFDVAENYGIKQLIGSAGSFETFRDIILLKKGLRKINPEIPHYHFELQEFLIAANQLKISTHSERLTIPGIIPLRTDMIVTASLLTQYMLETLKIKQLSMSDYSLKEGLAAMLSKC